MSMFCECRTVLHELNTCEIYRCKECGAYIGEGQNHVERPQGGFVHVACTRRPNVGEQPRIDATIFGSTGLVISTGYVPTGRFRGSR